MLIRLSHTGKTLTGVRWAMAVVWNRGRQNRRVLLDGLQNSPDGTGNAAESNASLCLCETTG